MEIAFYALMAVAVAEAVALVVGWVWNGRPCAAGPDGKVAILFSDIEESTALNERIGDRAWVRLIGRHDKLIRRYVQSHRGHVVKSQGDGFRVAFAEPEQAVRCSIDVQRALSKRPNGIRARIGIHSGKSVRRGDDLFGRNVAMAARVAAYADGGQTLGSEPVRESVDGRDGIAFDDDRDVELEGFSASTGFTRSTPDYGCASVPIARASSSLVLRGRHEPARRLPQVADYLFCLDSASR